MQLEKGGKAECGGLFIGDVIYSINSVSLSGLRSEAIALVKQSGHMLVLEIERYVIHCPDQFKYCMDC